MVIIQVFTKNLKATYKSTLLSKATFLSAISLILSIVLPFIIAYRSKGFWLKRDIFYEQPNVKFKGEYIFTATTDNIYRPIITCSTMPYYEKELNIFDNCEVLKVRENDGDFDGKVDELHLSLQVNLPESTKITSISLFIPLDYRISNECPLHMQSAIIYQNFLPIAISHYMIQGEIKTTQSSPLICHRKSINTSYNNSIISNKFDGHSYKFANIIKDYAKRNVSTKLTNVYTSFIAGTSGAFNLNLEVKYSEQPLYYKPHFWQVMKQAWIQYFALYVIISWVINKIKTYIFNKKLVLFYECNPCKNQ